MYATSGYRNFQCSCPVVYSQSSDPVQILGSEGMQLGRHEVAHGGCQSWVDSEPEASPHDAIRLLQLAGDAKRRRQSIRSALCRQCGKRRLANEIAGEEHTGLNLLRLQMRHHLVTRERRLLANHHHETKPTRVRTFGPPPKHEELIQTHQRL